MRLNKNTSEINPLMSINLGLAKDRHEVKTDKIIDCFSIFPEIK